jgi:SAM-dependent methyltransferase
VSQDAEAADRTAAIRRVWEDGAYEDIGALFEPISAQVVGNLALTGRHVLDAATGTGNSALLAARAGAQVEAFDLTPRLLDIARARAASAGLDIRFREGDLVDMPYPDASFDVVLSTFGAFTVDDPRRCAEELLRVTRPGGSVVSTAWSDEGMFAALIAVVTEQHPGALDPDRPDPAAWADASALARIFAGADVDISVQRLTWWFRFPSLIAPLDLLERASGPVQRLRAAVEAADGDWTESRDEILARWSRLARSTATGVELPAVYGVATVTVR